MGKFVKGCDKSVLLDRPSISVNVEGKEIAIFKVSDQFFAIENNCSHRGGPLSEGDLDGNVVTCPWHGFQFDVMTGNCATQSAFKQSKYNVQLKDDEIWIEI